MTNSVQPNHKGLLIQRSFYLFLGKALPVIILFLITIIYSRKLTYDDYGTFQSVWMYANIVNVIISFGLSTVVLSTNLDFLFSFLKKNRRIIISFYSALSAIVLLGFFFFSKNLDAFEKYWIIAFIIIQNIITVSETLLVKQGGERQAFVINFFYSLLFFFWHLYILRTGYVLADLIAGICIISILKLMATIFFTKKSEVVISNSNDPKFLGHWAYLGFNEILGIISKWIDKIFLLYLLTSADFAIFFNGSFEIPLFGLLVSVTGSLLSIEISADIKSKDKITGLFRENFNMLSSIVFPLFFFLLFFREEIFSLAFKNKYNASIPIFVISIFVLPIRINNYSVILQCFSRGKKVLLGSIMDIMLAVILMIILYPAMGTRGIALAIVIATWCQVVFYVWHSIKVLEISITELVPVKKLVIKFLILLLVYGLLFLLLQNVSMLLSLAVAAAITTIAVTAGMWSYIKPFFQK
ncbi:MAG: polysaccharide biosynthesis C-terminal domain-containing protein [Ginsengibacter sp.]